MNDKLGEGAHPESVDLMIVGPDIVTMNAQRSVIRQGAIAVRDGRIVWLGRAGDADGRFTWRERLSGMGRIALPGLIDTHFHTGQQLLRGKVIQLARQRQLRLPIWRNYLIPFESVLSPDDVHLSAQVAYANMLSVGTTCFAEAGGPHPDEMGRAAEEMGIRAILALSTLDQGDDIPRSMRLTTRRAIDENVALIKQWNGTAEGRVQAWLALRQLLVCSEELWEAFRDLADELGVRIHIHLAEGTYEVDFATERWGKRPVQRLEQIRMLGPRLHAAHSILLSDDELELFATRHPTVAHCPMGNFIIGPPRVPEMRRLGVAVGVGSDGASNGSIDLFQAMHVSSVALQSHYGTPWHARSVLSPEDALDMATIGGARALGLEDKLGSLEVGKRADLLLIDPQTWDLGPVYDPMFTAAQGASGANVRTVLVAGEVLMKDRELLTVDEEALRARLGETSHAIMTRFEDLVP